MASVTIQLTDQEQARLTALAEARGVDVPECARALLGHLLTPPHLPSPDEAAEPGEPKPPAESDPKPLWRRAVEAGMAIPADERARLPRDGSRNADHYVYGLPKQE